MGLDIRMPIGIMFALLGVVLSLFGALGDQAIYARSLGINVNLEWGLVLLCFSAIMIGLAMRAHRRPMANAAAASPRKGR